MADRLGILVTSDRHFGHVVGLVEAAAKAGKEVSVFFTGEAVKLSKNPDFGRLPKVAKVDLCEVSYQANGLEGDVAGLNFKNFATQAKNAEMIEDSDRYLVF
jgi:predicted peroxiredoxin